MSPSPSAPWTADFDFYEARMDDARTILALDLAARESAPLASHPHRLQVRVRMLRPREDGLRSSEEADALFDLEDKIADSLEDAVGAIQVGRVLQGGYSEFIFYVSAEAAARCDEELGELVGDTAPYELEWFTEEDPEWGYYADFLWPDAYAYQGIMNRRLMAERAKAGDCPEIEREIDHFIYFKDEGRAREAADALADAGFRVEEPDRTPDDGDPDRAWSVSFHRDDRLDDGRADEIVCEILDIILPLEGEYDGWGAVIERRDG